MFLKSIDTSLSRYSSFVYWGFLQEKITSTKYTNESDNNVYNWQFPFALNVFMALATSIIAGIGQILSSESSPEVPFLAFAKPAITCAIGTLMLRLHI